MSKRLETARLFFDACESGKGWEACQACCHPEATFSAQTDTLAELHTLTAYADWMKGLLTPIPDARFELKCMAEDEARSTVAGVAVFHGTHTGPGGPVEPTGKTAAADYVLAMEFDGDLIRHVTKIWNDAQTVREFGWA